MDERYVERSGADTSGQKRTEVLADSWLLHILESCSPDDLNVVKAVKLTRLARRKSRSSRDYRRRNAGNVLEHKVGSLLRKLSISTAASRVKKRVFPRNRRPGPKYYALEPLGSIKMLLLYAHVVRKALLLRG